jgi:hypothetical protein
METKTMAKTKLLCGVFDKGSKHLYLNSLTSTVEFIDIKRGIFTDINIRIFISSFKFIQILCYKMTYYIYCFFYSYRWIQQLSVSEFNDWCQWIQRLVSVNSGLSISELKCLFRNIWFVYKKFVAIVCSRKYHIY